MISRSHRALVDRAERLIPTLPPCDQVQVETLLNAYKASGTADNYDRLFNAVEAHHG